MLPEILVCWYTQKRDITLKQFDAGAVCFSRNETGEAVAHCSNTACPISSYHLSCLKLMGVSKNWIYMPFVPQRVHHLKSQKGHQCQMTQQRKLSN